MLKILERNPLVIKSLGGYLDPIPLIEFMLFNYWGRIDIIINKNKLVHDYNWYESDTKHPSHELLDFMRSC